MRVLGLDPGLSVTGYACIDAADTGGARLVEAGFFDLRGGGREIGEDGSAWGPRLVELARDAEELLGRVEPGVVSVEALFAHRAHPRAALAMAHARGVLLERIARRGVRVVELAPASVKKAVTGLGRASKDQVAAAVVQRLGLSAAPEKRDVTDAMAVALAAVGRVDP